MSVAGICVIPYIHKTQIFQILNFWTHSKFHWTAGSSLFSETVKQVSDKFFANKPNDNLKIDFKNCQNDGKSVLQHSGAIRVGARVLWLPVIFLSSV